MSLDSRKPDKVTQEPLQLLVAVVATDGELTNSSCQDKSPCAVVAIVVEVLNSEG